MTALAPLHPAETTLIDRVARATGTRVLLVYNWDADPEQPWETICHPHGGVCSHQTRAVAEAWLSHPDEWCEDCMHGEGSLDGSRARVQVGDRCPGCGVVCAHPDVEHLNDCRYQGRGALVLEGVR